MTVGNYYYQLFYSKSGKGQTKFAEIFHASNTLSTLADKLFPTVLRLTMPN